MHIGLCWILVQPKASGEEQDVLQMAWAVFD